MSARALFSAFSPGPFTTGRPEMVRARIELNRDLDPVPLPASVMSEICRHALDTAPEECCGLVVGSIHQRFEKPCRITNVMTKMHLSDPVSFPRDARQAYYMTEVEYLRAQQEAEGAGRFVSAVYHSHVDAGAYLSNEDLAYAEHPLFPFPGAAQIVISVLGGRVKEAAIFEMDPVTRDFRGVKGRLLEVTDA
ncbi:Mov34/MPN/PAD-1 family protein [Myxococcota bacterium]|nr:Mov34/MPN/PAD-1 family protein [Myxococcota bacterium]